MKVVANATPLIALSLVDHLDLLPQMFAEVIIPQAVYEEAVVRGRDKPGGATLARADWFQVQVPTAPVTIETLLLGLDPGELQVLLLARSVKPDWVLIDERLGRRVAQASRISVPNLRFEEPEVPA